MYQEAILSKRKLYLTPIEAWFECGHLHEREDQCFPNRLPHIWYKRSLAGVNIDMSLVQLQPGKSLHDTLYEDYNRHVRSYASRSFSHDEDIYDAF